jgi:hypothetical protein
MRRVIRVALLGLVALAVMVPAHAAGKVTVGDFLTQIAQVKNLPATDAATAAASLRAAGVVLPVLDVKATLDEGSVAKIASSLGLNVSTNNPAASFSAAQADAFVSTFASELGRPLPSNSGVSPMDEGEVPPPDPCPGWGHHHGHGHGHGHHRSHSCPGHGHGHHW